MGSMSETRAIVPFRHRHDGWTPERQAEFLERLQGTGSVTEACRAVGLTTTSAYRAFHRMPDFAMHWNRALAARRPMLEDAAFERAVHGSLQPLTRLGKVIGQRRRYSDSLLRYLLEREDRREATLAKAEASRPLKLPSAEESDRALLDRLEHLAQRKRRQAREQALASEERVKREGKVP